MERQKDDTIIEIKENEAFTGGWVGEIQKGYDKYNAESGTDCNAKQSIYRWPQDLVIASSGKCYHIPLIVSFGPYHHGRKRLRSMEHHKMRAVYRILKWSKTSLSSLVSSLQEVEQELRSNYNNLDTKLSSDSFLKMMLLDGCFMLELLQPSGSDSELPYDRSFSHDEMLSITVIHQDMLMLENQIPLLVIKKLLEAQNKGGETKEAKDIEDDLINSIIKLYGFKLSKDDYLLKLNKEGHNGHSLHVLDAYRKCLVIEGESKDGTNSPLLCLRGLRVAWKVPKNIILAILVLLSRLLTCRIPKPGDVRSAMRFHEAGIEFKKSKLDSGLKIDFDKENGVLTLPRIIIDDHTAVIYMNLMAFERMHPKLQGDQVVTSYVAFMDKLIDTAEDVSLLSSRGIVSNHLGSDEDAAKLFNNLGNGIIYSPNHQLHEQLQHYVASDWNAARAHFKHMYFKNPWSIISLLGAILLLALTITQTVASLLAL